MSNLKSSKELFGTFFSSVTRQINLLVENMVAVKILMVHSQTMSDQCQALYGRFVFVTIISLVHTVTKPTFHNSTVIVTVANLMKTIQLRCVIAEMRMANLWTIMAGTVKSRMIVIMNDFQNITNHQRRKQWVTQNVITDAQNIVKIVVDS